MLSEISHSAIGTRIPCVVEHALDRFSFVIVAVVVLLEHFFRIGFRVIPVVIRHELKDSG